MASVIFAFVDGVVVRSHNDARISVVLGSFNRLEYLRCDNLNRCELRGLNFLIWHVNLAGREVVWGRRGLLSIPRIRIGLVQWFNNNPCFKQVCRV